MKDGRVLIQRKVACGGAAEDELACSVLTLVAEVETRTRRCLKSPKRYQATL